MALLMRALAGAGRLPEALRAYQRYRVTLSDEMGLDPSSELRALESELLTDTDDDTRDLRDAAAAGFAAEGHRHVLVHRHRGLD